MRSSLVTRGSTPPDACQLRPDIALTEPEQLNNLIQLIQGSFAASGWGRIEGSHSVAVCAYIVTMKVALLFNLQAF